MLFQHFKITPLNFGGDMPRDYVLSFILEKNIDYRNLIFRAGLTVTTENNTWCELGYYDGENKDTFAEFGYKNVVTMKPEKFIYIQDNEKCRDVPYVQMTFEKISAYIKENCTQSCRLPDYYLCKPYMKAVGHLPICDTEVEDQCYKRAKQDAIEEMQRSNLHKPCTKLQYKYDSIVWKISPHDNQAKFEVKFLSPARVKVKEEYLIYNLVSMISAIGGTMGLFIGFSFTQVSSFLLEYLELGIIKMGLRRIQDLEMFQKNETVAQHISMEDIDDLLQYEVKDCLEKQEERLLALKNKHRYRSVSV